MYTYICILTYIKLMHATIVQEIDQRAQTYAIQQMHATIIQTIGHRALHKHMHATIVQTIDQRAQKYCKQHANICMHTCTKHEHMQFNGPIELCMNMCIHVCVHTDKYIYHLCMLQV